MPYTSDWNLEAPVRSEKLEEKDLCRDPEALGRVKAFLESYRVACAMIRLSDRDREAARDAGELSFYGEVGGDREFWIRRMQHIRSFIDSLGHTSAKLLLYYHYVRGETVERAAESLFVSRRGAFRLKKRALALAASRYPAYCAAHPDAAV